jgi:transposase/very-short-patch-repair endonuclease
MANKRKFSEEEQKDIQICYDSGMSINSIAKLYGVSFDTIKKVIGEGFEYRYAERKIPCPDVEKLRVLIIENKHSKKEIGEIFGVSHPVITRWLKEHNLHKSKNGLCKINTSIISLLNDKEYMESLYNQHGTVGMSEILGITDGTVGRYLEKLGIDRDKTFGYTTSSSEIEIANFLRSKFNNIITNTRKIVAPYELDIFIPEKNLAVEFNGLYWHSEKHKSYGYHYDKWLECSNKGIQLIQIWEDDWDYKKDIVKQMLLHKLSISDADRIYARNCQIVEINQNDFKSFMDSYHIQGGLPSASVKLGLLYDNSIVAAMSFTKSKDYYTLTRYATSSIVIGGFTKLLKFFENLNLTDQIVTFADLAISNGQLYQNSGFTLDCIIPPDYSYYANNRRVHKFNYRKSRFQKDESLLYEDGLTEKELAQLNKLYRIYDAGKLRYVKKLADI